MKPGFYLSPDGKSIVELPASGGYVHIFDKDVSYKLSDFYRFEYIFSSWELLQ